MAIQTIFASSAFSLPDTVTAPGAINTKGAYLQLVSSSSFDAKGIIIVGYPSSTAADMLVDIATGGSGSESPIITNFPMSAIGVTNGNNFYGANFIPIAIAAGSRVSARYQTTSLSAPLRLGAYLIAPDSVLLSEITATATYGANTTDSGGTSIDPGGTANTKGSYTQITASTSADLQWLIVGSNNQGNTARTNAGWLVDIATGGSGSESVIISNLCFSSSSGINAMYPWAYPAIPIVVSSGTRLSARAQCTTNDATDRLIDISLIALSGTHSGGGGGSSEHFSASFGG